MKPESAHSSLKFPLVAMKGLLAPSPKLAEFRFAVCAETSLKAVGCFSERGLGFRVGVRVQGLGIRV